MKSKRKARRRDVNGYGPAFLAAREAYHDAWYALLLEQFERYLRDPKRRARIERMERDILEDILKDLPR